MSKSLTLSMSLALAFGFSGVSFAGHHGTAGCDTCGLASPQGVAASPQGAVETCDTCAPAKKKHCFKMPKISLPKCTYTYEWVLKKKHVWNKGCGGNGCGNSGCNECGGAPAVYPTSQVAPSGQGAYAAPQYAAPQYAAPTAAGQTTYYRPAVGEMRPALAADEVPPAPTIATGGSSLLPLSPSGN